MPPDFLLACEACGAESVWDTETLPPVGRPEVGHPVVWSCASCRLETRHRVVCEVVLSDKLYHDICVATELARSMVERVMVAIRERYPSLPAAADQLAEPATAAVIAQAADVPVDVVREVGAAAAVWSSRRGYGGSTQQGEEGAE